jgi:hypothetical protein
MESIDYLFFFNQNNVILIYKKSWG